MPMLFEKLNCKGYWGFGAGYELARIGPVNGAESYCSRACPITSKCWDKHRERVEALYPDASKLFDLMCMYHGGQEAVRIWIKETNGVPEPYMALMTANLQDGAEVYCFGKPKNRGRITMPWPIKEN